MENPIRMTKAGLVRVCDIDFIVYGTLENPLFNAKYVTDWLGEKNPAQLAARIPDEWKTRIRVLSGCTTHDVLYLTEYGLYKAIFSSRTPKAKEVCGPLFEALHKLRYNGYVVSDTITDEQVSKLVAELKQKDRIISDLKNDNARLEKINEEGLIRELYRKR